MGRPAVQPIGNLRTYPKRFVTPAQLAEYVIVTRRTIYHHIEKGALKIRRIGGVIRIRKIDAMLYAGEIDPRQIPRRSESNSVKSFQP